MSITQKFFADSKARLEGFIVGIEQAQGRIRTWSDFKDHPWTPQDGDRVSAVATISCDATETYPDQLVLPGIVIDKDESRLTVDLLEKRYGVEEHPRHAVFNWTSEARTKGTRCSYWEWVFTQLQQEGIEQRLKENENVPSSDPS